jgi:Ca-activated chloride channel family protein
MEHSTFGILSPTSLVTLAVLLVIGLLDWRFARARAAIRSLFGLPLAGSTTLRRCVSLTASLILIAAVSRPFWGFEDIETETSGSDILFLVDISRSMYAQDTPPSRIELAKRKMKDLIQLLSLNGAGARFGITVFAGDGYTVCPVTTDRGVLAQFIDIISPDLVSSLGSNLKAGLSAALARLDDVSRRSSRIILISDGEDNFLDQASLVAEVRQKGVRLDVLGVGTATGAAIVLPNGATVVDGSRQPVTSALSEEPLRALAEAGGGIYTRASLDDTDVQALSEPINLENSAAVHKSEIRTYREIGPWLALLALIVLVCSAFSRRVNPLLFLPLLVLSSPVTSLFAQTPPTAEAESPRLMRSPFESYRKGDYSKAMEEYTNALKRDPTNRTLLFGLGSALHRLGRYQESAEVFHKLSDTAQTGRDYFESKYNEGNALLALRRYGDAIDAYWRALDVKPDDPAASHNLSVARSLLEAQQRATPTPTATPTPEASPQPDPSPSPAASPSLEASPSASATSDSHNQETPSPPAEISETPSPNSTYPASSPSPSEPLTPIASPKPDGSPQPPPGTPSPETNEQGSGPLTPTPSDRLKEALQPEDIGTDTSQGSPVPEMTAAMPEADAWLESLPDSPLLIRKYRGTPSVGGQTW